MRAPIACCSAISNGRGSIVASSWPFLTICPSLNSTCGDHARDLRPHRHRDERRDGAERVEHDRQVGARRDRRCRPCSAERRDRRGRRPPARPATAGPAAPSRRTRRCPRRRRTRRTQRRPAPRPADGSGTRRARARPISATTAIDARRASAARAWSAARQRRRLGEGRQRRRRGWSMRGGLRRGPRRLTRRRPDAARERPTAAGQRHAQSNPCPLVKGLRSGQTRC